MLDDPRGLNPTWQDTPVGSSWATEEDKVQLTIMGGRVSHCNVRSPGRRYGGKTLCCCSCIAEEHVFFSAAECSMVRTGRGHASTPCRQPRAEDNLGKRQGTRKRPSFRALLPRPLSYPEPPSLLCFLSFYCRWAVRQQTSQKCGLGGEIGALRRTLMKSKRCSSETRSRGHLRLDLQVRVQA